MYRFGVSETLRSSRWSAWVFSSGLKDACFSGNGGDGFKRLIDLFAGVFAGHDGANTGFAFGDGGEGDAGGHDAGVEEGAGEVHGAAAIADEDGCDGSLAFGGSVAACVKAGACEFLLEVGGVGPKTLDAVGLVFEDVECGDAGGSDRWRVRGGEEEGAGAMVEIVDEVAAAAHVTAECSDGLGEGADLDVDFIGGVKVIDGAAAVAAEDA